MSEIDKYKDQKQKLENLCEEHNLTFRLNHDTYPITLRLSPLQGVYAQMSMLEDAEDGAGRISPDAVLILSKRDGEIIKQITGIFTIPEVLEGKFRNIFKKLCDFWEQYFFRSVMETNALRKGTMPVIDEDEADDSGEETSGEEMTDENLGRLNDEEDEPGENDASPDEDLLVQATQLVRMENKCTVGLLQRRLRVGYSKALHLIDLLEERGVVGPYRGAEPREVLPTDLPEDAEG